MQQELQYKPRAPEYKKKLVDGMVKLVRHYPIIALVNMENLPAPQLQSVRAELRGKVNLFMTKKRLMDIAIESIKNEKKGIEKLKNFFEGMPALIFTKDNPFKLSKILQKSKTAAPAKPGQTAPDDIIINKGPTPFAPGPIISELSSAGLKVGVEAGKVAIKEDTVVVKKGEKIKPKIADILARLDIKPMQAGLGLIAAYENGIIYQKELLEIDEKEYYDTVSNAAMQAFNLAFNIAYTTKDNVALLLGKAFNDAKALGISCEILDNVIVEELLTKAEISMLSLGNVANIEAKKEIKDAPKSGQGRNVSEGEKKSIKEREKKQERKGIEKEKELEKTGKGDDTNKKVAELVRKAKQHEAGTEPTAEKIINEINNELIKPEGKEQNKEVNDREEVEKLTKELLRKGTLRKNKG